MEKKMSSNKNVALAILPIAATLILSGCAKQVVSAPIVAQPTAQQTQVKSAPAMKSTSSQMASSSQANTSGDSLLPPAKPGECYSRILYPATYENRTETILKRAASERLEIIPAKYAWAEETIQTGDSSFKLVPVSGEYETKTTKYQVSDGRRFWTVNPNKGAAEANSALLDAAQKAGIVLGDTNVGTCYHEHFIPPTYKMVTEEVVNKEAIDTIAVVPAKYEWAETKVLIKEASFKLVNIPETYKKVSEKILVEPAKTIWKKGQGPVEKIDNSTGEIVCLVDVPAVYKTVTKTIVAAPASTKRIEIPAEYKMVKVKRLVSKASEMRTTVPATYKSISRKVLESDGRLVWHEIHDNTMSKVSRTGNQICLQETPPTFASYTTKVVKNTPSVQRVEVPATHKTIKVRKLVTAAETKRITTPAEYQSVTKRVKVTDERMEWVPILCETNFNIGLISQLQTVLETKGFDPGPIDGTYGAQTHEAITRFQKKKGMPSGHLTIETLRALGVAY